MKHKFIIICSLILIVGLALSSSLLRSDFQGNASYSVEGQIIQAYFQETNASSYSGIAYPILLSYILIANITNHSSATLLITNVQIFDINHIIYYNHDFADNQDYLFPPNSSRIVAFREIDGLDGWPLQAFKDAHTLRLNWMAAFHPKDENGHAGFSASAVLPLKGIGSDQFVYGNDVNDLYYTFGGELPIYTQSHPQQLS